MVFSNGREFNNLMRHPLTFSVFYAIMKQLTKWGYRSSQKVVENVLVENWVLTPPWALYLDQDTLYYTDNIHTIKIIRWMQNTRM